MNGLTEVQWSFPVSTSASLNETEHEREEQKSKASKEAVQALLSAQSAARDFEKAFCLRSQERERLVPTFDGDEVVISAQPTRYGPFTAEHELRTVRVIMDLHKGSFGGKSDNLRRRFADRSIDGHFAIKFLQLGIINTDHASNATTEMVLEARILMNLAPHPNIAQCYGVNSAGIDSLLVAGRKGFFIITDRIAQTLTQRIQQWRQDQDSCNSGKSNSEHRRELVNPRLEIATDIASALTYLHSRKLVYYLRPDKVGFDTRYGRVKLCEFGQARQHGMAVHARSLTKATDIRTVAYTAPEVFCQATVTTASDVYAFGMMVWELLSLQQPFDGWDRSQHFQRVVRQNERPSMQAAWPKQVCKVIEDCWDPHLRPTLETVHENLETALLFQEDEVQQKKEFLAVRRNSNCDQAKIRRNSICDEAIVAKASESRFAADSHRHSGVKSAPVTPDGSPTKVDHTPEQPRRVCRRHSDDNLPIYSVDPQYSTQSTPGGVDDTRKKKSRKVSRRSSDLQQQERCSSTAESGGRPVSGRCKSLRIASSKLAKLEALIGEQNFHGDEKTAGGSSKPRRIKVRGKSFDKTEEGAAQILAALGVQLDHDDEKSSSTSHTVSDRSIGNSAHDGGAPAPKTPRHLLHSHDGVSQDDEAPSSQESTVPTTPTTPKTPQSRKSSNSVTQESPCSQESVIPETSSNLKTPKRRFSSDGHASSSSSSSPSSAETPSHPKTPRTPQRSQTLTRPGRKKDSKESSTSPSAAPDRTRLLVRSTSVDSFIPPELPAHNTNSSNNNNISSGATQDNNSHSTRRAAAPPRRGLQHSYSTDTHETNPSLPRGSGFSRNLLRYSSERNFDLSSTDILADIMGNFRTSGKAAPLPPGSPSVR